MFLGSGKQFRGLLCGMNRLTIQAQKDIAGMDPRRIRRASRLDLGDADPAITLGIG